MLNRVSLRKIPSLIGLAPQYSPYPAWGDSSVLDTNYPPNNCWPKAPLGGGGLGGAMGRGGSGRVFEGGSGRVVWWGGSRWGDLGCGGGGGGSPYLHLPSLQP